MNDWKSQLLQINFDDNQSEQLDFTVSEQMIDKALGQDSGITNKRIFLSEFSAQSVDEFIGILKSYPPEQYHNDLGDILEKAVMRWCNKHSEQCPYEPFLWAVKITDGYICSIQGNGPKTWTQEAVCKALKFVWEPFYMNIVRNIITTWDWYQPIHIMLFFYGTLRETDEEIEKYIRTEWLYRALYSKTAFYALCNKQGSPDNIRALMYFAGQDSHMDRNNTKTEIKINNQMRDTVRKYISRLSAEEYDIAREYYEQYQNYFSNKGKRLYSKIFVYGQDEDISCLIEEWNQPSVSDEKKDSLKLKLIELFDKKNDRLIVAAGKSGNHELAYEVKNIVERRVFSYATQFHIIRMMETKDCSEYGEFISEQYEIYGNYFESEKSFVYGCAYCYLKDPQILNDLILAFFLNGTGNKDGRDIFFKLRKKYRVDFERGIKEIVSICSDDFNSAKALIKNCTQIYVGELKNMYPKEFDDICQILLKEVYNETKYAPGCAEILMDFYDNMIDYEKKQHYYEILDRFQETKSPSLQNLRERASRKIHEIFPT